MEIVTRDFGPIEVDKEEIIEFPRGLPGFLGKKKFVFLPVAEKSPFIIMQSLSAEELAFVTIEPGVFINNYHFDIDEQTATMLQLEDNSQVTVFNIIRFSEKLEDSTVNLAAPLLVNFEEKLGLQVILDNTRFPVRYSLFAAKNSEEVIIENHKVAD